MTITFFVYLHNLIGGTMATKGKSNRGFASMDETRQREIASQGGKAAHQKGTAHEFTTEEARAAGRKGGQARGEDQSNK
jgi:general stress protein YciG